MPEKLASGLAASLSVVMGTAPVLLAHFGYVSVVTVFLNLIVLPVIPVLYVLSLLGSAVALIVGHNFVLSIAAALAHTIVGLMQGIDFSRFLLFFNGDFIILIIYIVSCLLTTERLNTSKTFKKFFYILLPATLVLMI